MRNVVLKNKRASVAFGKGCPGWNEYALGRVALTDARQVQGSGENMGSALLLYRAAIDLMTEAHIERFALEPCPSTTEEERWTRVAELSVAASVVAKMTDHQRSLLISIMGARGERFLANLSGDERDEAMHAMNMLARGLSEPFDLEVGSARSDLLARRLQLAGLALVVAVGAWFSIARLTSRENVALHQAVIVEISDPQTGIDPSLLVDGNRTNLGFHTIAGPNQRVTIDLGRVRLISLVVVYNRTDCCQERAVPLTLELSEDGVTYRRVAARIEPFDDWRVKVEPTNARYVRLTDLGDTFFHLAEVEVY